MDNLTDAGFNALHFTRIAHAPLHDNCREIDVLVIDLHMPLQSGDSIVNDLHAIGVDQVPVIFISSDLSNAARERIASIRNSHFIRVITESGVWAG